MNLKHYPAVMLIVMRRSKLLEKLHLFLFKNSSYCHWILKVIFSHWLCFCTFDTFIPVIILIVPPINFSSLLPFPYSSKVCSDLDNEVEENIIKIEKKCLEASWWPKGLSVSWITTWPINWSDKIFLFLTSITISSSGLHLYRRTEKFHSGYWLWCTTWDLYNFPSHFMHTNGLASEKIQYQNWRILK